MLINIHWVIEVNHETSAHFSSVHLYLYGSIMNMFRPWSRRISNNVLKKDQYVSEDDQGSNT